MTTLKPAALLFLAAFATASAAVETSVEEDVLTLADAARLLRVPSKIVVKLAQSGSVPARRVGKEWRFNRVALMEWLQGERYAYPAVPLKAAGTTNVAANSAVPTPAPAADDAAAPGKSSLVPGELAALSGRGIGGREPQRLAQAAPPAPATTPAPAAAPATPAGTPAAPGAAQQPIGEAPSGLTAEEVALRDQGVLLKAGQVTLEAGLSYSRQTRETFPVARIETDTSTASFTGRYGIRNDLQISGTIPGIYRHRADFVAGSDPGTGVSQSDSDSYAGDLSLSLQGVALRERVGRPNVVWSLDAVLPTGPGDMGLGGGLVLSKSYDPVVIYGGVRYLYGSDVDRSDPRRVLAKNNWSFNLGYAYAVNDSVALSGALAGFYRTPAQTTATDPIPPERESYLLQLGLTWQLGRGLFIEPTVAFGLGGVAPDFTFAVNVPYTF